jgi:3-deoxy-manno-octulosonate cytidylyltransferase (CMP-KDO synthetase)
MSVLGVIPARYASTRFPGKPLAPIAGKPMIQHVYERVTQSVQLDAVLVATDDSRILNCVVGFGGRAELTSAGHASGTDRLGEVAGRHQHDYYVNVQGDEPLIDPVAIDALVVQSLAVNAVMSTLVTDLRPAEDQAAIDDPNVVKAVVALDGRALYFSRAALPYPRRHTHAHYLKHIGIYMYARDVLALLCSLAPTALEQAESLEQLRALDHGIAIHTVRTAYNPIGVDTPADIARVEAALKG